MNDIAQQAIEAAGEADKDAAVEASIAAIVGRGAAGAFAVAGIATAVVILLYLAFYCFAYLPRGVVQ